MMDGNNTTANQTLHETGIRDPVLGGTLLGIDVFIIFLNLLVVMVVTRFRTKNCIDILVLGLAMTDLTKGLIPVPMSVATYLTAWYMRPKTVACEFFGWIAFTTNSASMLILTMMAIERFVAVVKPFSYRTAITKRRLEVSVLIAVVFSCFISALPVFGLGRMNSFNKGAYCHFDYSYRSSGSTIYAYFILAYGFAMTFVVLTAYSIIFYKIRDLIKRHKRFAISRSISSRSSSKRRKSEKGEINLKVEKMFSYLTLGLLVLFWISWFPFLAVLLLNLAHALPLSHDNVDLFAMRTAVINSMLNPIACALLCKPYRRGFVYYYKRLLSYAGFAKPDSDVFDPWRQKSRDYTREQTPANSFAQPESRRTYPLTGVCSGADSGVVGDSPTQFARICSHHEPSHNSEQSSMEDGRLNGENELDMLIVCDESSRCNGVDALLLNNEEESILHEDVITKDYKLFENNVIRWKQNRISQELKEENVVKGGGFNVVQGDILIHGKHEKQTAKERSRSKLKRYSMPVTCVSADKNSKQLSIEVITRKHGKYRPWSLDINDKFREWLQENAFESNVQLIGYSDLNLQKAENVNSNIQERKLVDGNMNDTSEPVGDYHKNQEEIEKRSRTNRGQRRRNLQKFRSRSSPISSENSREERSVKFSSLRDDLDSSLLEMDLLAKGLLRFSKSKLINPY